jgi:hypothetical protein
VAPSDRLSDPGGWWPTPPPKPLKAPSAAKLVFGTILPAVAVVGAVVALSTIGHSSHKPEAAAAGPVPARVTATEQSRRQAFRDCMKSLGAGSGFRGGRFGGGPSKSFRTAYEVCRSLLATAGPAPVAPQRTGTTAPPVA